MFRSKQQRGFTLIELVVAIAIIGISTAMVSNMIVSGLKLVETTESDSQDFLRARAVYETLLAIDSESEWSDGGPFSADCDKDWDIKSGKIKNPDDEDELFLDTKNEFSDLLDGLKCREKSSSIDGEDTLIFTIASGSNGPKLELAVPQ